MTDSLPCKDCKTISKESLTIKQRIMFALEVEREVMNKRCHKKVGDLKEERETTFKHKVIKRGEWNLKEKTIMMWN